ncbi:hypothetical protein PUT07_14670 [Paenibacillus sp. MAHUQ-63]|nr:hypothetical protein [Paenibacillus sp. MAHUQ-63]
MYFVSEYTGTTNCAAILGPVIQRRTIVVKTPQNIDTPVPQRIAREADGLLSVKKNNMRMIDAGRKYH